MLITVYEHSNINVGKERDEYKNQISYEDRDDLLKKEFKDKKQNFYEKRYFQVKKIFEWNNSNTIRTSSIVGTVKIDDDLTIEILPKIFNNNMDIKIARKNLIRLVEITEYEDIWDNETNIEEDAENIPYLEFIILRFTTNLLGELQKGIYAEYVTKIEESSFVRGAIQPHLQDIFDKSKVVCKFQELSFNNKLMQTFKSVAEHLLRNSGAERLDENTVFPTLLKVTSQKRADNIVFKYMEEFGKSFTFMSLSKVYPSTIRIASTGM